MQFRKRALPVGSSPASCCGGSRSCCSHDTRRTCRVVVATVVFLAAAIYTTFVTSTYEPLAFETLEFLARNKQIRFKPLPVDASYGGGVLRYAAVDLDTRRVLSYKEWMLLLAEDPDDDVASSDLAYAMTQLLQAAPFRAVRFETPPVSRKTVAAGRSFEFVLVEDDALADFAAVANPKPFAKMLDAPSCEQDSHGEFSTPTAGCVFANRGGDATLVAPRDWSSSSDESLNPSLSCYGHLANFVREAPEDQVLQLWSLTGRALNDKLLGVAPQEGIGSHSRQNRHNSSEPLWFSTAGTETGVAWVHFRLDTSAPPQHYHYDPYRDFCADPSARC